MLRYLTQLGGKRAFAATRAENEDSADDVILSRSAAESSTSSRQPLRELRDTAVQLNGTPPAKRRRVLDRVEIPYIPLDKSKYLLFPDTETSSQPSRKEQDPANRPLYCPVGSCEWHKKSFSRKDAVERHLKKKHPQYSQSGPVHSVRIAETEASAHTPAWKRLGLTMKKEASPHDGRFRPPPLVVPVDGDHMADGDSHGEDDEAQSDEESGQESATLLEDPSNWMDGYSDQRTSHHQASPGPDEASDEDGESDIEDAIVVKRLPTKSWEPVHEVDSDMDDDESEAETRQALRVSKGPKKSSPKRVIDSKSETEDELSLVARASTQPAGSPKSRRRVPRVSYAPASDLDDDLTDEIMASEDAGSDFESEGFVAKSDSEHEGFSGTDSDNGLEDISEDFDDDDSDVNSTEEDVELDDEASTGGTISTATKTKRGTQVDKGIDASLPPMSDIDDMFLDITSKALDLGLGEFVRDFRDSEINVATMCSGTEAPLLSLQLVSQALHRLGKDRLSFNHRFSAEIEPYKQAFIERNFHPKIIFRDIRQFQEEKTKLSGATTAYGADVEVPGGLDLLIAGFSCVDRSNLNNKKKETQEEGESRDTFMAILAYVDTWRPSIVLLENVRGKNKHWEEYKSRYDDIGYEAEWIKCDTKNYYLPQTRERGYMLCIERAHYGKDALAAVERWKVLMEKFRRQCSSPFGAFFPEGTLSKRATLDSPPNQKPWHACRGRHEKYRFMHQLGNRRPITQWEDSGGCNAPDFGDHKWYNKQVKRVYDVVDMYHVHKAPLDDLRYKQLLMNLSQNIDRQGAYKFGLAPCITPTGIPYVTDRAGPLNGYELLRLQGLPIASISFTRETQVQLQNLAGNAMSTTVVGCAALAALLCGKRALRTRPRPTSSNAPQAMSLRHSNVSLVRGDFAGPWTTPLQQRGLDLHVLMLDAHLSRRLCYCEGHQVITKRELQQCRDCKHTTCVRCGGNPQHSYEPLNLKHEDRMLPQDFERKWRPLLPARLKFTTFPDVHELFREHVSKKQTGVWTDYQRQAATASMEEFCMDRFERGLCWKIMYESPTASLELRLDQSLQWRLYAKAPPSLPSNCPLRKVLSHPLAQGNVQDSLLDPSWEWWIPESKKHDIRLSGSAERASSWHARIGLLRHQKETQPRQLVIGYTPTSEERLTTDISGVYTLFESCATAKQSLYIRDARQHTEIERSRLYLFLDSDPLGEGSEDCFVISKDHRKLPYGQIRETILRLASSWRPWDMDSTDVVHATTEGSSIRIENTDMRLAVDDVATLTRTPISRESTLSHNCSTAVSVLECRFNSPAKVDNFWSTEQQVPSDNPLFFGSFSWALEKAKRAPSMSDWQTWEAASTSTCQTCGPNPPRTIWRIEETAKKTTAIAYEESKEAATFERAVKNRPEIFVLSGFVDARRSNDTTVRIGVNFASLAHRAMSRINKIGKLSNVSWRLITDHMEPPREPFAPFRLQSNSSDMPFKGSTGLRRKLGPAQQRSLTWMRKQETETASPFTHVEVEEAVLPQLGWRAEVRAKSKLLIRGGLLADLPSFGKTVTTIALIQAEYEEKDPSQILRENIQTHQVHPGLIPIAATLVVSPSHITMQWKKELQAFMKKEAYTDSEILRLDKIARLENLTIGDFMKARVIIVSWNVLVHEKYISRLANFTALPEPVDSKGRSFEAWLEYAVHCIPEEVKDLQRIGAAIFEDGRVGKLEERLAQPEFQGVVPSKRYRGKAYVSQKNQKKPPAKAGRKSSSKKSNGGSSSSAVSYGFPLLHLFSYNRVVLDEYAYLYGKNNYPAAIAIKNLHATKRWVLSGTPALSDFTDVNQIASFLGASLGSDVLAGGITTRQNGDRIFSERTQVEKFLSLREVKTYQWHKARHEHAQRFLDQFARQNKPVLDHIKCEELLQPVELDSVHRVVYVDLTQHFNSHDMRFRKINEKSATDRNNRLKESLNDSATPEDALIKCCLSHRSNLDEVVQRRQQDFRATQNELLGFLIEAEQLKKRCSEEGGNYDSYRKAMVTGKSLDDLESVSMLKRLIKQAEQTASKKKSAQKVEKPTEKLRAVTNNLWSLSRELESRKQGLRLIESIRRVIENSAEPSALDESLCNSSTCGRKGSDASKLFVSWRCGHLVCRSCLDVRQKNTSCMAHGCGVAVKTSDLITTKDWQRKSKPSGRPSHGRKLDAVVSLLKRIPKKDQGIIFVQNMECMKLVGDVLNYHRVRFCSIEGKKGKGNAGIVGTQAAAVIEDFKTDRKPSTQKKVILLNLQDETSSGMNLVNANHIIFISPLLVESQYEYDAAMAQAIARARRYRQKKTVYIYHFAASKTIDVDIIEQRHRRTDALMERPVEYSIEDDDKSDDRSIASSESESEHDFEIGAILEGEDYARDEESLLPIEKERTKMVRDVNGKMSLIPVSWLSDPAKCRANGVELDKIEDFTSLIKFSETFEDAEDY